MRRDEFPPILRALGVVAIVLPGAAFGSLVGGEGVTQRPVRSAAFPARIEGAAPVAPGVSRALLRPQRPLQDAERDRTQAVPLPGLGLDSERVRARMVERLRREGVRSEAVLQAMGVVPRHLFVDSALANQAYEDTSLPIGHGQTISKPVVVARMVQLLYEPFSASQARRPTRILEIGTGCGYQAAVLSMLSPAVVSIERIRPLHEKARRHLDVVGARGVRLVWGDGREGHGPQAPFDGIIAAAGGEDLPQAWLDQLAVGGRLVAPMHSPAQGGQVVVVVDRHAQGWHRSERDGVHFVPLKAGVL